MSGENRILDAEECAADIAALAGLYPPDPSRNWARSILASHEALRAALETAETHAKSLRLDLDEAKRIARQREQRAEVAEAALVIAEAERDTWKAYAARVAQEARDDFGAFEAAVERVGVLEAALRAIVDGWEAERHVPYIDRVGPDAEIAAARAVLAVPEGDAE